MTRLAALLVLLATRPATAQAPPDRGAVVAGAALVGNPFGDAWATGPGAVLRAELPLHGGTADAVLRLVPFDGRPGPDGSEAPDFLLVGATLGWGPSFEFGRTALTPSVRVGGVLFRFDPDDDQVEGFVDESEVAVGAALRAQATLGRVVLWAEGEALRVALREAETLVGLSAGVGLRFGVPPAVRRLLDG